MIVVTGGTGFIGSNIIAKLNDNGYEDIAIIDWLGNENKWKNIEKRKFTDIVLPENVFTYLSSNINTIEAIIHMGAISSTMEKNVDLMYSTNVKLSWDLWNFCRKYNKQFIYASSAATYGNGEYDFNDYEDINHLNRLQPLNPYGWSKSIFDRKIVSDIICEGKYHPQYVGLKFFNVYGPNEYHKGNQKSVVAHIFPNVKTGESVNLFKSYNQHYKDGYQLRDFVWVDDCASVVLWFLKNNGISGIFNVGSGEAKSFYDLAKATFNAVGTQENINYIDMPYELRNKYQYYTKANISKLRSVGYLNPMTKLEDGVYEYVTKYLNNKDIYR